MKNMDNIYFIVLAATLFAVDEAPSTAQECEPIQYLSYGSKGTVQCSFDSFVGVIWKSQELFGNDKIIVLRESGAIGNGYESGEYNIHPNGSLIINNVTLEHDTNFTVIKLEAKYEIVYEVAVTVIVTPVPAYPVVKGCHTLCTLPVEVNGTLTCQVFGVRPRVKLRWKSVDPSQGIVFSKQTIDVNGTDIFDISVEAQYAIKQPHGNKLVAQCEVSGPNADMFDLQTKVELKVFDYSTLKPDVTTEKHTEGAQPCTVLVSNNALLVIIVILTLIILIISMAGFWYIGLLRRKENQFIKNIRINRNYSANLQRSNQEERRSESSGFDEIFMQNEQTEEELIEMLLTEELMKMLTERKAKLKSKRNHFANLQRSNEEERRSESSRFDEIISPTYRGAIKKKEDQKAQNSTISISIPVHEIFMQNEQTKEELMKMLPMEEIMKLLTELKAKLKSKRNHSANLQRSNQEERRSESSGFVEIFMQNQQTEEELMNMLPTEEEVLTEEELLTEEIIKMLTELKAKST